MNLPIKRIVLGHETGKRIMYLLLTRRWNEMYFLRKTNPGSCAVGRQPCHTIYDIEIWEAIEPPPDMQVLPLNGIMISALGYVNSEMAGGDLDGDLDWISFCSVLVKFVDFTQSAVDTYRGRAFFKEFNAELERRRGYKIDSFKSSSISRKA